ncbi:flippase [Suicoccus acidiformans]|uniref:Flippase n=1 Tax=Suicoccus acidiformans TaxID=2036206 RepID=A0A347WJP8_9LACT|nr:lipopolysaccharide biosynthesis protein [Suicoccus acidiformans]AXY25305.1 flippase [Suicoccus acidiformans]
MKNLKEGIIYNAIGKYSNVIITFLVQVILSRLLAPDEFGIIAVVNVFLVFFQLLSDFGIGPAIIQRKDIDDNEVNQIFSFSVYFSLFLTLVFTLLAYPISRFYRNPELVSVVPVMSLALLFNSLCMVPQNLLLKEKHFKLVNMVQIIGSATNGLVSVLLAFRGFSYYSIILGNISRAFFQWFFYMYHTRLKFYFRFSVAPLKKIYKFARNQFGFNVINYFSRNLDSILIGRYMSAGQLGYYDKAYQLSLYPNTIFTSVITSAIQPIFSEFQDNLKAIKDGYLNIAKALANFGVPLTVFLWFTSEDIILFLYGDQWQPSVLAFKILSLSVWIQMLQSSTGAFFQSANRTDLLLTSGILSTLLNIIAIVIGISRGSIYWVAIMIVISFSMNFLQTNYLLLNKTFGGSLLEAFKVLVKPTIMGIVTLFFLILLPINNYSPFINLIFKGIAFLLSLILGLLITNQMKELLILLKR